MAPSGTDNLYHVSERKDPPPPLEADDRMVTVVVTAGWAVAFVVLLIVGLPAAERWWLWTCAAGFGMGMFGLWYVPFLRRGRSRASARRPGPPGPPGRPGAGGSQRDSGSKTVSSTETPGSSTRS
jgi:Protein of unknown function (DUF2530)